MATPIVVESFDAYPADKFLRVAETSDIHFGELLSDRRLKRFLGEIDEFGPDLYLNLGDNCHGWDGFRKTKTVLRFEKEVLNPSIVRAGLTGNHDYWLASSALPYDQQKKFGVRRSSHTPERPWVEAFEAQVKDYEEAGCHFFNEAGPLRIKGYTFFGSTLWYAADGAEIYRSSNDYQNMPLHIQGLPIHVFMHRYMDRNLKRTLLQLTDEDKHLVFCSHMPIVELDDPSFAASPVIGRLLQEQFGVTTFLNGHHHKRFIGPTRFSSGSDYGKPAYLLLAFPLNAD